MPRTAPDPTRVSRFIALVLRHDPAAAGLTLDAEGWASVDALLQALRTRHGPFPREALEALVAADSKGRYALSADGSRIRANQGHSVPVELGLAPATPPDRLFHGTVRRALDAILREGLKPMGRHHVHLSSDMQTATAVGSRRGEPVILAVDARGMNQAGHLFYRSANGVWLTDTVPPASLSIA